MKVQYLTAISVLALVGSVLAVQTRAESTTDQLTEQATGNYQDVGEADSTLKEAQGGQLAKILAEFAYLDRVFQLMDEFDVEDKLQASFKELRNNPRAVGDLMRLYKVLTEESAKGAEPFGEARWRTLYVLGELRDERASDFLFEIAAAPMPGAKGIRRQSYQTAYRLRARAIAGLEKLRQIDRLRRIYEGGGLMAGLAAATLFELGEPPKGIAKIDATKVLGLGDPTDYNPRKGEISKQSPQTGIKRVAPGDDDEPVIAPRTPTGK
jgi:hypothetical protein